MKHKVISQSQSNKSELIISLREHQLSVYNNLQRFNILIAHRRFGKTVLAIIWLLLKALQCPHNRPQVHYFAPTYSQAKRVAWAYLKDFCATIEGTVFNEAELKAVLPTGATIQLGSADNPDASRGIYSDACVLDEPAQMPPRMWSEILRPALSDRKGCAMFIGTPNGRQGLFYDTWEAAENDDTWYRGMFKASETGVIDPIELQAAKRVMSKPEYEQEYECSFDSAIKGAYWAEEMTKADTEGRIGSYSYDSGYPVHIAMDLGINDATACWFYQINGNRVNLIDYKEYVNTSLPDMVTHWRKMPYVFGKIVLPHDAKNRSLSTGITRQQTLQDLGCDTVIAPKGDLIDGIELTRRFISKCCFNKINCFRGIEALRMYRSDYDDKKGVLMLRPVHDWTSHPADAFRYLATVPLDTLNNTWSHVDYTEMDRRYG